MTVTRAVVPTDGPAIRVHELAATGLNYTQIAAATGVARNTIAQIAGRRNPHTTADTAARIYAVKPSHPPSDRGWTVDAACRTANINLFYPDNDDTIPPAVTALCDGCPVYTECLRYAIDHHEHGIWAGTTPQQRTRLARRARRLNQKTAR